MIQWLWWLAVCDRFLGTTPDSTTVGSLLSSIIHQLTAVKSRSIVQEELPTVGCFSFVWFEPFHTHFTKCQFYASVLLGHSKHEAWERMKRMSDLFISRHNSVIWWEVELIFEKRRMYRTVFESFWGLFLWEHIWEFIWKLIFWSLIKKKM